MAGARAPDAAVTRRGNLATFHDPVAPQRARGENVRPALTPETERTPLPSSRRPHPRKAPSTCPATSRRLLPPVGAPEADILRYRDRRINRWSIHRNMHMGRIALSIWYYLSRQWASFDLEASFDGVRGAILRDLDSADLPRPITNYVDPAVEQEIISLIKHEWIPKVYPTSNDPSIKAAAQVAEDLLNYKLTKLHWPEKRHLHALYFAVGGTGLIYTGWNQSYNELKTIGAPSAVWCDPSTGGCGTALYSADVPDDLIAGGIGGAPTAFANNARPVVPDGADALSQPMTTLGACPTCSDQPRPLTPYEPPPDVAGQQDDPFGRPMGVQVPRGESALEIDLPSELHPWNGGIRVTPDALEGWGRRKIRSMEWWEEHAPHVVEEIPPDAISEFSTTIPYWAHGAFSGHGPAPTTPVSWTIMPTPTNWLSTLPSATPSAATSSAPKPR